MKSHGFLPAPPPPTSCSTLLDKRIVSGRLSVPLTTYQPSRDFISPGRCTWSPLPRRSVMAKPDLDYRSARLCEGVSQSLFRPGHDRHYQKGTFAMTATCSLLRRALLALLLLSLVPLWPPAALADPAGVTYHNLHSFNDKQSADGANPRSPLVEGNGLFYGTTSSGGLNGSGTVFQLSPDGTLTTLHSFSDTADGSSPNGLVRGRDGSLYGTARTGGPHSSASSKGGGTIFKLTPDASMPTGYRFAVVHYFDDTDKYFNATGLGYMPGADLVEGHDGYFYGTTLTSGRNNAGAVFRVGNGDGTITPGAPVTFLDYFSSSTGSYCVAALVEGSDGSFYGNTQFGSGPSGMGYSVIFKIKPGGPLIGIQSFDYTGGIYPLAALVKGRDGYFYGVASAGGVYGYGTIFKIGSGDGTIAPGAAITPLHSLRPIGGPVDEGGHPYAALLLASDGYFYGTTSENRTGAGGTVFRIGNGDGTITTDSSLKVLHPFSQSVGDGNTPFAALIQGRDGKLYGTTLSGKNSAGVLGGNVFQIDAGLPLPVNLTVSLTAPTDKQQFTAPADVTLTATASAGTGATLKQVEFFKNGVSVAVFQAPGPYSVTLLGVSAGTYTLTAVATDTDGQSATSAPVTIMVISNPPPSINVNGIDYFPNSDPVQVYIHGANFMPGADVTIGDASNGSIVAPINVNDAHDQISFDLVGTLPPGPHTFTVTNPDRQSASQTLVVQGPPPGIYKAVFRSDSTGNTFLEVIGENIPETASGQTRAGAFVDGRFFSGVRVSANELSVALGSGVGNGSHTVTLTPPAQPKARSGGLRPSDTQPGPPSTASATARVYKSHPSDYDVSFGAQLQRFLNAAGAFISSLFGSNGAAPAPMQTALGGFSLPATSPVITLGAGNVITSGAGNVITSGAGNVITAGAGNVITAGAGNVITSGAGNVITSGAGNVITSGAGNVITSGAGNILVQGKGGNVITSGAGNVITSGAGNLTGRAARSLRPQTPSQDDTIAGVLATLEDSGAIAFDGGLSDSSLHISKRDLSGASGLSRPRLSAPAASGSSSDYLLAYSRGLQVLPLLVMRYTPGQPDQVVYQLPGVTLTPTDSTPAPAALSTDVTGLVMVTRGPVTVDHSAAHRGHLYQTLTLTSSRAFTGPIQLLLTGLPVGAVTVANASGDLSGSPYLTMGALPAGRPLRVQVYFNDPTNARFNYAVQVVSGTF